MIYGILVLTNILSIVAIVIMIKKTMLTLEKMDEISKQVEESLDIIDDSYKKVSRHLKSPVLFDDPVVVEMIKDVKNAREAMLLVANKIVEPFYDEISKNEDKESE
jgi:hypothetical protein